jgi:tetratricopeptide (TPR) repeat protein
VKQARLEAGLSLGQVARSDISRTAIYFVETGKAKPSMETLQLIAERTGRPVEYFLEAPIKAEWRSQDSTSEIEGYLATGDNAGAAAAGEQALGRGCDDGTAARIKFLLSTAYLRLAEPFVAQRYSSVARAHFERTGNMLMVAECLGNEASAAYLMEDPAALTLAEGALATCRLLKPVPPLTESRLLAVLAGVHVTNQDWEAAVDTYRQAISAGDVVQDLRRLSLMYSGLSLAYQELGEFDQAGHFAQRALNIHQTLNDRLSLARSENNLGILLLRGGDTAAAGPHIRRALEIFEEAGVEIGKANGILSLSELALAKRDVVEAERYGHEALELARRLGEFGTVAEAHYWLAKVAEANSDDEAVDAEFEAAFDALGHEPGKGRAARYHAMYAEILEERGDLAAANRQLKLALAAAPPSAAFGARVATA